MAPKQSPPPKNLPVASSDNETDEEEEYSSEEEQRHQDPNHQKSDSEPEPEEEDPEGPSEDEAGEEVKSESSKGSGSDSDSDDEPQKPPVKPIASKPMENTSKSKKPAPLKPSAKRPAEPEQNPKGSRNKKSKISNGNGSDPPIEEKKSGITRLWSEDDEIALLQGMIDYQAKKGSDPYLDIVAFLEFVKGSLDVVVSKNQVADKIRRLKKKYQNNAERGEDGENRVFSKTHEVKSFELSKRIWGNGVEDSKVKTIKRKVVGNSVGKVMERAKGIVLQESIKDDDVKEKENKDFWSMFPRLSDSFETDTCGNLSKDGKNFAKEIISSIGMEKALDLEEKWKDVLLMEYQAYAKRVELIHEQTQLVLDVMKP